MKELIRRILREQSEINNSVKVQTGKDGKILIIDVVDHIVYRYELIATGKKFGVEGSEILNVSKININGGSITIKSTEEGGEDINETIPQDVIKNILTTYNKDERPKSFPNIMTIQINKPKMDVSLSLMFIDKIKATPTK